MADEKALVRKAPYDLVPGHPIGGAMVTTALTIEGTRIVQNLGVVRGIVVRSRSVVGNIAAGFQMLFGGNISIYSRLCEEAREEAFRIMLQHAAEIGANAVVAMRYDATEIMGGVTEVLAYGTAVVVESAATPYR
jgi:uncharacterized protein YbjQ (UPF0145 family)